MRNNKIQDSCKSLKILLLVIFSLYTYSITFCTHTHIIDGITIVHSHIFSTDAEGNPTHEHTGAEIQLINNLSTYYSLPLLFVAILFALFLSKAITLVSTYAEKKEEDLYTHNVQLRAPPAL